MKAQEVRELEHDELADKLRDSRRELYELRFKLAVGQLDDHRQIRKVRQDIARLLTFKRQRELGLLPAGAEEQAAPRATAQADKEEKQEVEEAPAAESESEEQE